MTKHRPIHPEYHVEDDMAKQAGHEVACLPVAHCEFNPIEMACVDTDELHINLLCMYSKHWKLKQSIQTM